MMMRAMNKLGEYEIKNLKLTKLHEEIGSNEKFQKLVMEFCCLVLSLNRDFTPKSFGDSDKFAVQLELYKSEHMPVVWQKPKI